MSNDPSRLVLYDTHGHRVGDADLVEGEVVFHDPTLRWTWVLDARGEPYASLPLKDVLARAAHARKTLVLSGARDGG